MCEHSLQNNLFFLIIPVCPVFPDSKSEENIQEAPKPGIQEREAPAVKPPPPLRYSSTYYTTMLLLLACPHLMLHRVDSHASWRAEGPRGERRAPCCSMPRHVSLMLHCGNLGCFHPTLAAAHRYVLVRPLWISPCPAWLAPCSRTFSPEAGI